MLKMPPEMIELAEKDKKLSGWFEINRLAKLPEDNQEQYFSSKEITYENVRDEGK